MAETHLVLQVLGTSDVYDGEKSLYEHLGEAHGLNNIEGKLKKIYEKSKITLPLIEKVIQKFYTEENQDNNLEKPQFIFGIILSDQKEWSTSAEDQGWNKSDLWSLVAKDGVWHQEFLEQWFENKNIPYYCLPLKVQSHSPYGVADWPQMTKDLERLLSQRIKKEKDKFKFTINPENKESPEIGIDEIIIQHSSGTPALTSALYLWGIKQKLGENYTDITHNNSVKFVYLPELKEDCKVHDGKYWQWHLRLPIVKELIGLQDFSGALKLIENAPKDLIANLDSIKKELEYLDSSVSLNLVKQAEIENKKARQDRYDVLERIAIALWSEKSFRDRAHWLHWYLRLAGIFDFALLLLVEKQANFSKWEGQLLKISQEDVRDFSQVKEIKNGLRDLVEKHLTGQKENPKVTPVEDQEGLRKFIDFYYGTESKKGFYDLRNELYHRLMGDLISEMFASKESQENHPSYADEALDHLRYILRLAGVSEDIEERKKAYRERVQHLNQML